MQVVGQRLVQFRALQRAARLALAAAAAHQALGQHGERGVAKVEGSHARVEQAVMVSRGAVGVQGRDYQVAGQRSLDGDLGGLAGLRISPTMMTSGRPAGRSAAPWQGPFDLGIHLHLAQAGLVIS